MVFESPAWARALPSVPLPDSITVEEFMYSEKQGRKSLKLSRNPYTCGLTGQTYTVAEVLRKGRLYGQSHSKTTGLECRQRHGMGQGGLCFFLEYAYSVSELTHQLRSTSAKVLFTCVPLLPVALEAAAAAKISQDHVFILDMPGQTNNSSNVALQVAYEAYGRKLAGVETQVGLGLLPFSHIYGLVIISHSMPWHGDEVVVLPRYDLDHMLATIQKYKVRHLPLVPPIAIQLLQNKRKCDSYDLSSIEWVSSGAAPLGAKTIERSIILGARCKVIDDDGREVTELEKPGELFVQSPNICLGYMNNVKATAETFVWDEDGRWLRTGDVVVVRRSPLGTEHMVIVDRIKELIKVKGNQVAPAELEAHLLSHPFVADCAVIPIPDDFAGEVPKASVVKDVSTGDNSDEEVKTAICRYVESHKAKYKWLQGGVEFIEAIPKSPSGKILRRVLQTREKEKPAGVTSKF
ncbi:phenylacetyl ligase [Fusarium subglutinans]|uniref:Phenylacetyl ligase n=1 Tax=Gibberella subglutinans TaxID=42677 RepID=A0A8H5QBX8_GIBSU|nr:phenylacetyl ligase [Fusarium subglutinans]KAF5611183.1 phenylacetyl ligase [Fusarium subglutinans]